MVFACVVVVDMAPAVVVVDVVYVRATASTYTVLL